MCDSIRELNLCLDTNPSARRALRVVIDAIVEAVMTPGVNDYHPASFYEDKDHPYPKVVVELQLRHLEGKLLEGSACQEEHYKDLIKVWL